MVRPYARPVPSSVMDITRTRGAWVSQRTLSRISSRVTSSRQREGGADDAACDFAWHIDRAAGGCAFSPGRFLLLLDRRPPVPCRGAQELPVRVLRLDFLQSQLSAGGGRRHDACCACPTAGRPGAAAGLSGNPGPAATGDCGRAATCAAARARRDDVAARCAAAGAKIRGTKDRGPQLQSATGRAVARRSAKADRARSAAHGAAGRRAEARDQADYHDRTRARSASNAAALRYAAMR